jgi:predicted Zn-dependent protease
VVLLGLRTLNAQQLLTIENDISWLVTNYSNDALILAISANYKARAGQALEALREFDYSLTLYPSRFELIKGKAKLLMESNKAAELEKFLSSVLKSPDLSTDPEIFQLRAQAYLAQGILMNYHFDLSMVAYLSGNLDAAIRELKIAREQSDGDFYVRSQLDSRLNNLLREQAAIQN